MKYTKALKYDKYMPLIMGPNPVKLAEELMTLCPLKPESLVMDLGSGMGLTSLFLAREYSLRVFATDLWSDPAEVTEFFAREEMSPDRLTAVHADANELPYEKEQFDAVVSTDSYNYFGRDPKYLGTKLLPFVKPGGYIAVCFPGMKKDLHDRLPPELLLSWTPAQLDYIHDAVWWKRIFDAEPGAELVRLCEMESNEECWQDWLAQENEYAVGDRKTMEAGGGRYLNFLAAVLRKKG